MDDHILALIECLKLGKDAGVITDIKINTDDNPPEIWIAIMEHEYLINIQDMTEVSPEE